MPQLPIYTRNSHIKMSQVVRRTSSGVAESMDNTGRAGAAVAVQWQKTQNAAESLDGKNKMAASIQDLLTEASEYNDYNTPKDIEAKQNEMLDRLHKLVPDIVSGFNTETNANDFVRDTEMDISKTEATLKGLFRKKYIDNNEANLIVSAERNRENFIQTGDKGFKQSYIADLELSYKNGFIDKAAYTNAKLKTDEWDKLHIYRQAESDPQGVIDNLKAGNYKIKPEDYNDVLKNLNSIKTNDELMRTYQETATQNKGESDAMDYIYSNASYADKLKYINDAEFSGNISSSYAQKARRAIKQFKPDGGKTMSQAQNIADVLQRAYDLNEGGFDSTEYLNGIRALRSEITEAVNNGDISYKDGVSLNNQLNQATRKRVSQETNFISYQFGKSVDMFKEQLPPEYRNDAIRELFYATQDIDDNLSEKEKQRVYNEKAVAVVDKIKSDNRLAAQKVLEDTQVKAADDFVQTLAAKRGVDTATLNKDIDVTAAKYGITRAEVINKLRGSI